ncbi:hypothetical protein TNCV_1991201 [Trichonephila clavipes]|nr:hypothetical protein TNCV_1991201 [Trichonephila clavipes]
MVSDADCCAVGTGFEPREDVYVCKCIVPSWHGGTLNSRQAASPLQTTISTILEDIPALYGKDNDRFEFHMDKTSSYTSKSTANYLAKKESETGIK